MVEQCFDRCAVASLCTIQLHEKVERSMGSIMKNHETNRGKVGLQLVKNEQVRPAGQAGYPISLVASLDTVPVKCCVPLPLIESLGGGGK